MRASIVFLRNLLFSSKKLAKLQVPKLELGNEELGNETPQSIYGVVPPPAAFLAGSFVKETCSQRGRYVI